MSRARILLAYREPFLSELAVAVLRREGYELLDPDHAWPADVVLTDDPSLVAAYPPERLVFLSEEADSVIAGAVGAVVSVPFTPASLLAGVARVTE